MNLVPFPINRPHLYDWETDGDAGEMPEAAMSARTLEAIDLLLRSAADLGLIQQDGPDGEWSLADLARRRLANLHFVAAPRGADVGFGFACEVCGSADAATYRTATGRLCLSCLHQGR